MNNSKKNSRNMKRNITIYTLLCMLFLGTVSCKDDLLYDNNGEIGEGECLVSGTIKFKPLTPALNGETRAAGNTIKTINSLCVLLYDKDGNLVKKYPLQKGDASAEGTYKLSEEERTDKNPNETNDKGEPLPPAESKTFHADFKLTIPCGQYYIYAVANMGDLSQNATELTNAIKEDADIETAIQTIEGLKSISLQWQSDNIAANNQMFGHFFSDEMKQEDQLLTINKNTETLYAWIRRAASKVTIAYDGSDLHENVYIYLKSVTIKDIPTECYLGQKSTINLDENSENKYGGLTDGEHIEYVGETTSYDENYPARITKGKPFYYYIDEKTTPNGVSVWKADYEKDQAGYAKLAHEEKNEALFFYENMQGIGEKDKRQDKDGDGVLDAPGMNNKPGDEFYKDQKPYGTYIEVKAYYVSNAEDRVGSGNITYRFMLGKNTTTDYNAERNHHYKLTLKFNKYANDVDWHIEYEEKKPSIEAPNPYYISYLYNRTMNLPIKINTGGGTLKSLEAKILTNNWAPYKAYDNKGNDRLDYAYWYDYDVTSQPGFSYQYVNPVQQQINANKDTLNRPWHGFLSLRKTTAKILTAFQKESNGNTIVYVDNDKELGNYKYYTQNKKGERVYYQDGKQQENDDTNGKFTIVPNDDEELINVSIPFYTRAKQLIISTSYTGNNPFVAYQRRATVEIKAVLSMPGGQEHTATKVVEIFQVRRLVNPKGIYRKYNNNKPFHVTLMRLPKENATSFEPFTSEGPWRATVVEEKTTTDKGFITLSTTEGSTGTPIDFYVNFHGECKENQSRHAIIRVEYHNYTCHHLIFVQQGDAPVELIPGGTKWHTRNLKTANEETDSPLDEGSIFKFGNLSEPIAALNQVNYKIPWINVTPELFYNQSNPDLQLVDGRKMKWSEIDFTPGTSTTESKWKNLNLPNAHVANFEDFYALFENENIEQGYGVLYGDESEETATDLLKAYGYRTMTREGVANTNGYGMRGCFIYNRNTSKNIFLPIGASGYGRRKRDFNENGQIGILRYSSGRSARYPDLSGGAIGLLNRPLFYDLYMRPGANYWLDKEKEGTIESTGKSVEAHGWDINYFTFDFNHLSTSDMVKDGYSDASFIRCVEDPN